MSAVKCRYHALVWQEQAAQTRQRIAAAAAAEFAEHRPARHHGRCHRWGARAGHPASGSPGRRRQGRVAGPRGRGDRRRHDRRRAAREPAAFADVYAPGIPARRRLEALAAATSDTYGQAGRLFLVLAEAAASSATAAELAAQASARRLADHRRLAGLLAPGASPAQLDLLTDTIWVLAGPAVYVNLVHRRHWPSAQYATWLTEQLDHAANKVTEPM